MSIKTAWMETRPILSIGPICVFMRVLRGSRMPCEPGGFSFELESAVQARHGHSKAKEDEDKRLWKKAWGFNLFPVFISPPGDKPCAIKNISYSHCLAAWPHLWRRLKDKMKGTKKKIVQGKAHLCTIGADWFHACVCLEKPWWLEFSSDMQHMWMGEKKHWSQGSVFGAHILS